MTNPTRSATLAATALLLGLAVTPAGANGQVSWTYAPTDRQAASTLDAGLRLYSIYNGIRDGSIRQRGQGNSAGLAQRGQGNLGLVQQRGAGHSGTLQQNGDRNSYGLFQFGRGANDAISQHGNGRSGATLSYGW